MTWANGNKMTMVLLAVLVAVLLASEAAQADFTFGEPTNLGAPINTSSGDCIDCFSSDGLEMYLDSGRAGGYGTWDIWVARRPTTNDNWGPPENLGSPVNSSSTEALASLSGNGLELYFESHQRPGGYGSFDLWVTKRLTEDHDWAPPVNLGPTVNSAAAEGSPWISSDGLELYFS